MKSTAPRSRALKTLRSDEREDTAITAVGTFAISQRRKAKPSITGISRSSVITSGRCRIAWRIPSSPLTAVATTSICGDDASIREIVTRLYAESSMTRARRGRTGEVNRPPFYRCTTAARGPARAMKSESPLIKPDLFQEEPLLFEEVADSLQEEALRFEEVANLLHVVRASLAGGGEPLRR